MRACNHFYGGIYGDVLYLRKSRSTLSFASTNPTNRDDLKDESNHPDISARASGSKGLVLAA